MQRLRILSWCICGTCLSLLVLSHAYFSIAHAASVSFDPPVLVVADTTYAKGQHCTQTTVIQAHERSTHTYTTPCVAGSIWEGHIVHRSQALRLHESYMSIPEGATTRTIFKLATQLKNQQGALRMDVVSPKGVTPFATACDTTVTHSVTWSYTDSQNYVTTNVTSRVTFYVYPTSVNCNQVTIESAGIHVNSIVFHIGYTVSQRYQFDQYASATYNYPGSGSFDSAGVDLSHSVNDTQPKGYGYETHLSDASCTCSFHWSDIFVN
jgi:hypothetical protein